MKRYIKTYLAAIVFICTCLSSCVDLDPVDYSEINPSNFPQSEEDLKALVLSCYYPLRGTGGMVYILLQNAESCSLMMRLQKS